jgi:hypothetical protein
MWGETVLAHWANLVDLARRMSNLPCTWGILGALIAVPKGALDLVTQLWLRADTSVMIKSVKITHVPKLQ